MTMTCTIGEAARAAGVGVETIRFYERKGLIERPPRPPRGARRYSEAAVERIRALRQGQALGFSLADIDALLALRADPGADCSEVRTRAEAHLEAIERRRARLGEVAETLQGVIAACPGRGAPTQCSILDAFTRPESPEPEELTANCGNGAQARAELRIDGMACGGCAARVRAVLRASPGVFDASVDLVTGVARLRVDPAVTDARALVARVCEAGFAARTR